MSITSDDCAELEALRNHLSQSLLVLFGNEKIIGILRSELVKSTESMNAAADEIEALRAENARLKSMQVWLYNCGYKAGHHYTVEGGFTDIHYSDMATYHADIVAEIDDAMQAEAKDQR